MVDGPRGAVLGGAPAGPDLGATQEERVDGQPARAQQPSGGRHAAATGHGQADRLEAVGRVVAHRAQEDDEGLAWQRPRGKGGQETFEIGGRDRGPLRLLERTDVDDHARAGWVPLGRGARSGHRRRISGYRTVSFRVATLGLPVTSVPFTVTTAVPVTPGARASSAR